MKLEIELVPRTSWYSNLRKHLSQSDWDIVRKKCYRDAGYVCEICGGKGPKWPVECHERWKYDDERSIQKLIGVIALCPDCHMVKHAGLAQINGKIDQVIDQLIKINKIDETQAKQHIDTTMGIWKSRSYNKWTIDWGAFKDMIQDNK